MDTTPSGGQSYALNVRCNYCDKPNIINVVEEWDTNSIEVDTDLCEYCGKEFSDKAFLDAKYEERKV